MFDWSSANTTELLQIAREQGASVSPRTNREVLIRLIRGEVEQEDVEPNPIDTWRDALMNFLLDHWSMIRAQGGAHCPASDLEVWTEQYGPIDIRRKPGLPEGVVACRSCTDAQVLACIEQNQENEKLIQLRRKT